MCTAFTKQAPCGDRFFGRTMDFSYPLDPELYFVPKGHRWHNILHTLNIQTMYRFMGIGQDISPLAFADGVNETGFVAAALYFPGFAQYDSIHTPNSKIPAIAALELVKLLLSQCASVKQACQLLKNIQIVGVQDPITHSIAPLHWLLADTSGACLVVEKTAAGLQLMDNPIGVLSNSPNFQWHMTNLRNYLNVTPTQQPRREWETVELSPFGQGTGTFGLPGDYTPPSRFVRAAYHKSHTTFPASRDKSLIACFHILESVSIPKGVVMTERGTSDYTQYSACIDLTTREYFFKTYDNSCVTSVLSLSQINLQKVTSLGKLISPVTFGHSQNEQSR